VASGSVDKLDAAWRMLQHRWHDVCEQWNDPVRAEFERETWQQFEQVVPATLEQMRRLGGLIDRVRREVR